MPTLACPDLGRFHFEDEEVIRFPEGLPAFESLKRFVLAQREEFSPFVFLVSVDSPSVRFVCAPAGLIDPAYRFEIAPGDGVEAGLASGIYTADSRDPLLLAIVTLPESAPATANLAAPVVIDLERHWGTQVILPATTYSHATPLHSVARGGEGC